MSRRQPRYEIVRVPGGRFVRFIAANNRVVWVTPGLLSSRANAVRAVEIITGHKIREERGGLGVSNGFDRFEVRDVDERGAS